MPIVSLADGAKLGRIDEVLFETQPLRVAALRAAGDGQGFVIPFAQLTHIGADAVTVESGQMTEAASADGAFGALPGLSQLKKRTVVDQAGTLVGTISGIALDPATGQMTGIAVRKGGLLGLGGTTTTIDPAAIRGVGDALLTVVTGGAPSA
jgi:sporulation protein YlmC with PRC-barrel domain